MLYKNNKTKELYKPIGHCINATNGQAMQVMVLYSDTNGKMFCREETEFYKKFTKIE